MRAKKKKALYVLFLLITVLMFLHSWKSYVSPQDQSADYAHKHHDKPHHTVQHHAKVHASTGHG
jgi:hypothetical protein